MPQALILIVLLSLAVFAQNGKVVGVADGDTITILSNRKQTKVRLAGIDAPEKGQDYSDAAKKYLSGLIFNQTIKLEGSQDNQHDLCYREITLFRIVRKLKAVVFHMIESEGRILTAIVNQVGQSWNAKKNGNADSRKPNEKSRNRLRIVQHLVQHVKDGLLFFLITSCSY